MGRIVVTGAAVARDEIAAQMANSTADIVTIEIAPEAITASAAIELIAREMVPHVTRIDRKRPEEEEALPGAVAESGSIRERVLSYLDTAIAADDPQREAILALAVQHLDHQGHR